RWPEQQHARLLQGLLAGQADLGQAQLAQVALGEVGVHPVARDWQAGGFPGRSAARDRHHARVPEALQRLRGQRRAPPGLADQQHLGGAVRQVRRGIALQRFALHAQRARGHAQRAFVGTTHVHQHRPGTLPGQRFGGGDLARHGYFRLTCRNRRRRRATWRSESTFLRSLYGFSPSLNTKRTGVPRSLKRLRKKFCRYRRELYRDVPRRLPWTTKVGGFSPPGWAKRSLGACPREAGGGCASTALSSARVTSEVPNWRVAEACARWIARNSSRRPEPCSAEMRTASAQ